AADAVGPQRRRLSLGKRPPPPLRPGRGRASGRDHRPLAARERAAFPRRRGGPGADAGGTGDEMSRPAAGEKERRAPARPAKDAGTSAGRRPYGRLWLLLGALIAAGAAFFATSGLRARLMEDSARYRQMI